MAEPHSMIEIDKDLDAGIQAKDRLMSSERKLFASWEAERKARRRTEDLPPPVDEVVANMRAAIDELAAEYATDQAQTFVDCFGGGIEPAGDGQAMVRRPVLPWFGEFSRVFSFRDFVGLCPDLVKTRLEQVIRSHAYESGTSLSTRLQRIAEHDARIADIEQNHTTLAESCGLPLLPTVQERRYRQARRRQQ